MKALLCVCGLVLLLASDAACRAGPVQGPIARKFKVPGGTKFDLPPIPFKGGERACVMVLGDHDPVVALELTVKDRDGKVVAQDRYGGDFCAAIWYPPQTAAYVIEIRNPASVYNVVYLVLK